MQLFQLAKEELRHIGSLVERIKTSKAPRIIEEISIPIGHIEVDKGDDESAKAQSSTERSILRLSVSMPEHETDFDHDRVLLGIRSFIYDVLYFAHNPLVRGKGEPENPSVTIATEKDNPQEAHIRFTPLNLNTYSIRAVGEAIDDMETAMFANWKPARGDKKTLVKTFATVEERKRVLRLFCSMSMADNMSEDVLKSSFRPAPNDHSIALDPGFLSHLADFEQTMEANHSMARG